MDRPGTRLTPSGRGDMDSSYPGNLRLWQTPARAMLGEAAMRPRSAAPPPDPFSTLGPAALAEVLYAQEILYPPAGRHAEDQPEPFTLQWYLHAETQRHGRRGRWIPRLLEFTKHAGETLLGLGHGLGTDWVQDRKSTRLNSSHTVISYAVFCLKKKKTK